MASTGIHRKIDDLGRIVIPVGIRRNLGINEGDRLEVTVEDERIVLLKTQEQCVLCSSQEDLYSYRERLVCGTCIHELGQAQPVQVVVLDEPVAPKSRKA